MIAWIQQYVLYILGVVIVLLLVSLAAQTVRLKMAISARGAAEARVQVAETQLKAASTVMQQLATQGEILSQRVKEAQRRAAEAAAGRVDPHRQLEEELVPKQCEEASKWAAGKASSLSSALQ